MHPGEESTKFMTWLRRELDHKGAAVSPRQRNLERLFRRAVELEFAFFTSSDGQETSGVGQ